MVKIAQFGICLNCGLHKELMKSHAINKTFFREISKNCTKTFGKPLVQEYGSMFSKIDGDQMTSYQMCSECEGFYNSKYENYSIKLLKNKLSGVTIKKTNKYLRYSNVDHIRLSKFILSTYWKVSNSEHSYLHKVFLFDSSQNSKIRAVLNSDKNISDVYCKLKMYKIKDGVKKMKEDFIKQIIMTPFKRYDNNCQEILSFMIFYGFLFELSFSMVSDEKLKQGRYLKSKIGSLYVDYIELSDIPEFENLMYKTCY